MLVKSFPTLYKKNSRDNIQVWDVSVVKNDDIYLIQTQYGQQGGKIQITKDPITEGKNLGRANATTPEKQAITEAKSKWTHKQDREGYVQKLTDIERDLRDGIDPMLAHRYDKYPHKILFPCYMQPKLDGHRCIAIIENGKCTLFSRTRNIILGVPHINEALLEMFPETEVPIILDGELYNHDYKSEFETLTSFIRSETPKSGFEVVQYHIYDLVYDSEFYVRQTILVNMQKEFGNRGSIRFVETMYVDAQDVVPMFRKYRSQGYEGGMLRNGGGKYSHKRSYDLLKVKEFEDAEFQIVAINEGRGKLKGHAIFECAIEDGITRFEAKLIGAEERLKDIFNNQNQYLGKKLTVQFQGRTKNNIPRFPVGVRIREDV
jgi:DNA ligase 1